MSTDIDVTFDFRRDTPEGRDPAAHQELIPDEDLKAFNAVGYTIGGIMVFSANRIAGKWTINRPLISLR